MAIEEKIQRLEVMKRALVSFTNACDGTAALDCPLVESLGDLEPPERSNGYWH